MLVVLLPAVLALIVSGVLAGRAGVVFPPVLPVLVVISVETGCLVVVAGYGSSSSVDDVSGVVTARAVVVFPPVLPVLVVVSVETGCWMVIAGFGLGLRFGFK